MACAKPMRTTPLLPEMASSIPSSEADSHAEGADSERGGEGVPDLQEQASEGAGDRGSIQAETDKRSRSSEVKIYGYI
ncbi:unnamed protein product [Nezara viridula]|uniref:Uncharacterized protein n=1 Tax=Nezara viridula TaxID=85310 RepID=A0A9P0MQF3_NEZVI|nr:unnamed protein product [Nezara viridula]